MMTTNDRMFVNNSMGTGKTISSLWAADYLMRQGVIKRCLIVAPLSTLKFTWSRAIFDNFLNRSFVVLDGARARRVKNLRDEYDFYIVNPEGLHILVDELALRHDINHVIVDELAMFRKAKERRLNLNSILNGKINRTAWGMTGEPTPDAPTDAYWQIRLIRPSAQASMGGYGRFRDDTMYRDKRVEMGTTRNRYEPRVPVHAAQCSLQSGGLRHTATDIVSISRCRHDARAGRTLQKAHAGVKDCC